TSLKVGQLLSLIATFASSVAARPLNWYFTLHGLSPPGGCMPRPFGDSLPSTLILFPSPASPFLPKCQPCGNGPASISGRSDRYIFSPGFPFSRVDGLAGSGAR